jgi:6-phosphofructokinase
LYGFLAGPHGVYTNNYMEITPEYMGLYRNTGGFDMIRKCEELKVVEALKTKSVRPTEQLFRPLHVLSRCRPFILHEMSCPVMRFVAHSDHIIDLMILGSGRHKIETPEQFASSLANMQALDLDGLVVIGGDDSNTNACLLAEYFAKNQAKCKVVGCPKTIDGDLKNEHIPVSFGFDTATTVYSEAIGNLCSDVISSKEYYHFIRLMGRSASHIALECALRTRINCLLVGEEVNAKNQTLTQITTYVADIICKRSSLGKNYGIMLVPEGLIEFIPEMAILIAEINELLSREF